MKIKDSTAVFDKQDEFNFHIVDFPHMDSNLPSKLAYEVYISQLVKIGHICDNYEYSRKAPPADL